MWTPQYVNAPHLLAHRSPSPRSRSCLLSYFILNSSPSITSSWYITAIALTCLCRCLRRTRHILAPPSFHVRTLDNIKRTNSYRQTIALIGAILTVSAARQNMGVASLLLALSMEIYSPCQVPQMLACRPAYHYYFMPTSLDGGATVGRAPSCCLVPHLAPAFHSSCSPVPSEPVSSALRLLREGICAGKISAMLARINQHSVIARVKPLVTKAFFAHRRKGDIVWNRHIVAMVW